MRHRCTPPPKSPFERRARKKQPQLGGRAGAVAPETSQGGCEVRYGKPPDDRSFTKGLASNPSGRWRFGSLSSSPRMMRGASSMIVPMTEPAPAVDDCPRCDVERGDCKPQRHIGGGRCQRGSTILLINPFLRKAFPMRTAANATALLLTSLSQKSPELPRKQPYLRRRLWAQKSNWETVR